MSSNTPRYSTATPQKVEHTLCKKLRTGAACAEAGHHATRPAAERSPPLLLLLLLLLFFFL